MKSNVKLKINSKVEIVREDGAYKSVILDLDEEGFSINLPVKDGEYLIPREGERIEGYYYEENDIYAFSSNVIGRKIEHGIHLINLSYPEKLVKQQRRNFVRATILKEVNCIFLNDNKEEVFKGIMLDLSGGGARISLDRACNKNEEFYLSLDIVKDTLLIKCKIKRIEQTELKGKVVVGVTFEECDSRIVEKIIRYVFEVIRIQRKNKS